MLWKDVLSISAQFTFGGTKIWNSVSWILLQPDDKIQSFNVYLLKSLAGDVVVIRITMIFYEFVIYKWCSAETERPLHCFYHHWRLARKRFSMMTSSNGNISCVTGPLCWEFTGHRWIPLTKASDAELWCFLWSAPGINHHEAGDLRRHHTHHDAIVMIRTRDNKTVSNDDLSLSVGKLCPFISIKNAFRHSCVTFHGIF